MAPQSLWYWGLRSASSVQNSLQTRTTTTNLCLGLLILEIYQSQGPVLGFWCRRVSVGFSLSRYYFSKSFLWEPQAPWNDTSPVEMAVVSERGLVGSQSRSAAERCRVKRQQGSWILSLWKLPFMTFWYTSLNNLSAFIQWRQQRHTQGGFEFILSFWVSVSIWRDWGERTGYSL